VFEHPTNKPKALHTEIQSLTVEATQSRLQNNFYTNTTKQKERKKEEIKMALKKDN